MREAIIEFNVKHGVIWSKDPTEAIIMATIHQAVFDYRRAARRNAIFYERYGEENRKDKYEMADIERFLRDWSKWQLIRLLRDERSKIIDKVRERLKIRE